ncbi:hypothetical protein MYX82_06240 [Acidobacteria bacterium AH-259-D05]|nr:hypothetical protein [Acidobacteria bacterium AH-259-D05]
MPSIEKCARVMIFLLLGVLFILPTFGQASGSLMSAGASVVAIEGGTLIDGTGKPPVAGVTILIKENRIGQIGKAGEIEIPAGARLIEAVANTLSPVSLMLTSTITLPFFTVFIWPTE